MELLNINEWSKSTTNLTEMAKAKDDAMKTAIVLSVGVVNPANGKTIHGWNIYESWADNPPTVYLIGSRLLFDHAEGAAEIGEHIKLVNNDTDRKVGDEFVRDFVVCGKDTYKADIMAMCKRNGYDYTPLPPYKARSKDNKVLQTSFVTKGWR